MLDTNSKGVVSAQPAPALPPFPGLVREQISLISNAAQAEQVLPQLLACSVLGFDTESRPTFVKGEVSDGPHLVQFAGDEHAWLFVLSGKDAPREAVAAIVQAEQVLKVGFGMRNDSRALRRKLGVLCAPQVDLARVLRPNRSAGEVGAKTAVERLFGQRMAKPKSVTTSNWANPRLSPQQILYAANDAYVALKVYQRWLQQGGTTPCRLDGR